MTVDMAMPMQLNALSQYSAPSDYETPQYLNNAAYDFAPHNAAAMMMQPQQHSMLMVTAPHDYDSQMNASTIAAATAAATTATTTTTTTIKSTLTAYFKLATRDYENTFAKTNNPCVLTLRVGERYYYLPVKTHDSKSYKKRGVKALSTEIPCDKVTFNDTGLFSAVYTEPNTQPRHVHHGGDRGGSYSNDPTAPYSPASSTSVESAATVQSPLPPGRYHLGSDGSSVTTDDVDINAMMSDDNAHTTNHTGPLIDDFHNFAENADIVQLSTPSREELLQLLGKDPRYATYLQTYNQAFMVYIRTHGGSRTKKCWFALQQHNWYKIELPVNLSHEDNISQIGLYFSVYRPVGELAKGIFKTKSAQFKEEELSENSSYTVLSGVGNGNLTRLCKELNIETLAQLAAYNSPHMPQRHLLIQQQKFVELANQAIHFLQTRHKTLDKAIQLELRDTTGRLNDSYNQYDQNDISSLSTDPTTPIPTPATAFIDPPVNEVEEPPELAYEVFHRLKANGVMSFTHQDNHDNDLTTWTDSVFKDCWNAFRLFPYHRITVTGSLTGPSGNDADFYIKRNDFLTHAPAFFGRFEPQRRQIETQHIHTLWTLATLPMPLKDNLTFSTFFRMFCFLHTRLSPDDISTPVIGLADLLQFLTYHLNFIKGWSEDHDLPLFCSRQEAERDLDQDPGMFYRLRFCEGRIDRFVNDAASTPREQRVPVYRQVVVSFRRCNPVEEINNKITKITWLRNEYVHHLVIDPASVSEMNAISGPTANGLILRLLDIDGVTLQDTFNFLNRSQHIVKVARIRGLEKLKENQRRAESGAVIGRKEKKQQQGGYAQRRSPTSNALPAQPLAGPPLTLAAQNDDLSRKRQRGIAGVTDPTIDAGTVYAAQVEPTIVEPLPSTPNTSQWSLESQPSSMASSPSSLNSYDQMSESFNVAQRQMPSFNSQQQYPVQPTSFIPMNRPHYPDNANGFPSHFNHNAPYISPQPQQQQTQTQRQKPPQQNVLQSAQNNMNNNNPSNYPFVNGHLMQPIDMNGVGGMMNNYTNNYNNNNHMMADMTLNNNNNAGGLRGVGTDELAHELRSRMALSSAATGDPNYA